MDTTLEKKKAEKLMAINRATAENLIPAVFGPLGINCRVWAMSTVALLVIHLEGCRWLHLHVGYREMRRTGTLDSLARDILAFKQAYLTLGHRATIKKRP